MFKFVVGFIWHVIQTTIHKVKVFKNLIVIAKKVEPNSTNSLILRGLKHDLSKYRWSEARHFAKVIFKLKHMTYGSDEYAQCLKSIQPSIDAHYKRNSHHPQYYEGGYGSMSRIDKLEMIADWQAAATRHNDGDILESIEINQKRFGYSNEEKRWLLDIVSLTSPSRP
jgi:hypothetical protein